MLLLAAGKTDYCLIKLEAGRLKVHINLGAGESEIPSAQRLTLNDNNWHEINLTRREGKITLQIDVIHNTEFLLRGHFFELNIHYGVFIGGRGDFNELFLGHMEYLRGCMANIVYNGAKVIEYARLRKNQSEPTAVTWGCSPEFDATWRTNISFVEDGSFIAITKQISRFGSSWKFELKTAAESGLLLYNTGQSTYADYLGIELLDRRVRVLMNKGNGPTELIHSTIVSDGKWHSIVVDFSPSKIGITVDKQKKMMELPSGGNRYLDLADTLYIGGTELNKRARAFSKGLKSGDMSYKGCIRNMFLDNKEIGLPDVKVSQGILAGCVWGFPCFHSDPCALGANCSHLGVASFKCNCNQPVCTKSAFTEDYKNNSNLNLPVNLGLLDLNPLSVLEGGNVTLTRENIAMVLDIAKYKMGESNVIFTLLILPAHGTLAFDLLINGRETTFTLHDVSQNKIQYVHDGSETTEDNMVLEVTLVPGYAGYTLPSYLQGRLRFSLNVNVTPVNDPPVLEIPSAKVLRLAQGTRKTLTKELIWTVDADTPPETLIYTVLRADTDAGHVEKVTNPSRPIDTFTQEELLQGLIAYVHRGNAKSNAMLKLQVSDGMETSKPASLRVSAYSLSIKLHHNTGLVVVHRSFSYITPANLSFLTNSDDSSIEIRYDIVVPPQYGSIQRIKNQSGNWKDVDYFSSKDVEMQSIRYIHNISSPSYDRFKFQASVREVRIQQTFEFNVTFIDLELKEMRKYGINFTNVADVSISTQSLRYQTNPLITPSNKIIYRIEVIPRYGDLVLIQQILKKSNTFTQDDVDSGKLKYRLYRKAYSNIEDKFLFKVSAPHCSDISSILTFRHLLAKNMKVPESIENLQVEEGSKVLVKVVKTNFAEYGVTGLYFNITSGPNHGWLLVMNNSNSIVRSKTTYFTLEELSSQLVYYIHDDSETREDNFQFLAISNNGIDFMYIGNFRIDVTMKNDNPPERVDRKVFYVVSKGERLLTSKDLLYVDKDVDTKPSNLVYTKKNIENGGLYKITDFSVQLNQFTQEDVNNEMIMFRHYGDDNGIFKFTVTDGQISTPGELEIQASAPYINLQLGNYLVVQFNKSATLTNKEIDLETNVYATEKDIKFTILEKPKFGIFMKHLRECVDFNQNELTKGLVTYKHLDVSSTKDSVKFHVSARGAETQGLLGVKIYPESYWESLIVQNNRTIFVEEATSILISNKSLEIMHPKIPANQITYYLQEWPRNGYLEIQSPDDVSDETKDDYSGTLVRHFEQNLINEDRLYYVQAVINQTRDRFVVDVTNGITWLRGLVVNFVMIPEKLYMSAHNLTVIEGKTVAFTPSDFYAITSYYAGKITDYTIEEKPKHGSIIDSTRNSQVKRFSQKHINSGIIIYKHNGDESFSDSFKMIVTTGDKTSEPFKVWINVQPVNDEVPILSSETNLSVWQGGSIVLSNSELHAIDNDTSPDDVIYNVTSVKNGFISLTTIPERDVYIFSQQQINDGKVLFTHTNGSDTQFSFALFDGIHATDIYTIKIVTKPVQLLITRNNALNVFPLTRKTISDKLLLTTCSDNDREIKYIVKNPPRMGKIIMETSEGAWQEVNKFTQSNLNENKVTYEHTKQFMDLLANDSFTFEVETHYAMPITNQVFRIDISVSSGGLDRYVVPTTVRVEEGGKAAVLMNISGIIYFLKTKSGITEPTVRLKLANRPQHGHVMLLPDLNITTFEQPQLESGDVAYFHDHSDTTEDTIGFSLYLVASQLTRQVFLCNVSVPVTITPVNDEEFKLELNEHITVVQNQNQTITRDNLLTTDVDTPSEDLIYEVISGPTQGRLLLLPFDQNSTEVHIANKFSQFDIDSSRVVYEHSGPLQAVSFYFRVWDGHFNHVYKIFNIHVVPIKLNVTVPSPVLLPQGQKVAMISEHNVRLDSNARQDLVIYKVTRSPKHGVLYVRNLLAVTFKQLDLASKIVIYMQSDMTVSNDSLELSAQLGDFEVKNIHVDIKVDPLMIINPLVILAGDKKKLTLQYLDATPLATLTNSNPIYTVTRKPKFARIKRIIRSLSSTGEKRGTREKDVTRFTHQEIVSGVIYLVGNKISTMNSEGVPDNFCFILVASIFQPAEGEFPFLLKLDLDDHNMTMGGPMDPVGHEGEMAIAPNMSNDYLLILGMLIGVFVLSVVVIITIRYRQNQYKYAEEDDKPETAPTVGVMPLPRPPDHLMPTTPHLKRFANDHNSLSSSTPLPSLPTMTSTLPQCKVIPLSPLESITGSEVDVSARYPYGVADGDEWSSFDTSELPCQSATSQRPNPLLRRNQYWV
ncbi:chondroitin sulfate proteoglycan 4 isoform X2 [Leptopilina heterotoma]|nr:chondroitin sulfate proteoglycan 4 isoform X2 [Leptopilina heterotoma]XP_043482852.1 chondroitin sulfate proteoglycan 4 isoform X2 [Leptopilina heterotoma]XP_043482853.1 chondroitin sulfate proteoglycan 4 isoform X2 [Leptopilina heterotoma]XP_043482854.1 chondroitin sulfate proteoglycan 4 isoform X2 [Leptopilina heterotoma]